MLATPRYVVAEAQLGVLAYDPEGTAKQRKVPSLHIAASAGSNPPGLISPWFRSFLYGCTVGAEHFNQLEAAVQVNNMIENFSHNHI